MLERTRTCAVGQSSLQQIRFFGRDNQRVVGGGGGLKLARLHGARLLKAELRCGGVCAARSMLTKVSSMVSKMMTARVRRREAAQVVHEAGCVPGTTASKIASNCTPAAVK
jgi:hypothetical protein